MSGWQLTVKATNYTDNEIISLIQKEPEDSCKASDMSDIDTEYHVMHSDTATALEQDANLMLEDIMP